MNSISISQIFKKHFGESLAKYIAKKIDAEESTSEFLNAPFSLEQKAINSIVMSSNIRYGDFIEEVVRTFLEENKIKVNKNKKNYDLYFKIGKKIYIGEIKMRDNHDSTKKRGQIDNLINKCEAEKMDSSNSFISAIFFFIDNSQVKNYKYYKSEFEKAIKSKKIDDYDIFYGDDFFKKLKLDKKWKDLKRIISKHNKRLKERNLIIYSIEKTISKYGIKWYDKLKIIKNIREKYSN